ncbi:ACR264Wp [Eremothecium gossypii ATCC 10895]|uniref:ACR264Wp n=1 Tax=Eremothecium gossypii (strain ATCC 10895 / CBS 109.51 / FGSC 9923 / NRRL Y-1056) TaxID=284811 RepID=Q75BK7_EREGS|nr:ACR264Wp [Eremothecium gossypii ATCC 10895]AAS51490.1 ACR264Wp [Eremothecium gossypii ATCC 10895]AEY95782.1 FACR264Wp [Eremothecium gossypii FDAG1]
MAPQSSSSAPTGAGQHDCSHRVGPSQQNRQDSMSIYTNFNQQRLSTDNSISSFLNIDSHGERGGGGSGGTGGGGGPASAGGGGSSTAGEMAYGRGYSIVNSWPTASQGEPGRGSNGGSAFTTARRTSEQLEPFAMPRFKTPSYSQGRSASGGMGAIQLVSGGGGGRNDSLPSSKRNSIFFGSAESTDLDFFNQAAGSAHGASGTGGSAGAANGSKMGPPVLKPGPVPSQPTHHQSEDIDVFFNPSLSRKNSIKFNADDFADFQFKRRDSSVRATLDNSNYAPGPPPPNANPKRTDQSLSPIGKEADEMGIDPEVAVADASGVDDVEETLKRHLSPLMTGGSSNHRSVPAASATTGVAVNKHPITNDRRHEVNDEPKLKRQRTKKSVTSMSPVSSSVSADHHIAAKLKEALSDDAETATIEDARPLLGATKVDQLMLVIQARKKGVTDKVPRNPDGSLMLEDAPSIIPPPSQLVGGVEKPKSRGVKQHKCPYCHKCFTQSTHLEVHVRSHIGYKPFQCEYCGKRFTQGGNLRTHVRLHTGERPYECDKCGKRFSRKGNLAAHMLTHENYKPFQCKLDDCNKSFTQLGNMKAHQNRFHLQTLNRLTQKLAEMDPSEDMPTKERELLEYFASLYKNSNRGIKGRGKGNTRIVPSIDTDEDSKNTGVQSHSRVQQQPPPFQESQAGAVPAVTHMPDPTIVAARALGSLKPIAKKKSLSDLNYSLEMDDPKDPETNEFSFHEPAFGTRRNDAPTPATENPSGTEVQFKNVFSSS